MLLWTMLMLGQVAAPEDQAYMRELRRGQEKAVDLMIRVDLQPLAKPQKSPKHGWDFPHVASGFGRPAGNEGPLNLRFRVFSQFRRTQGDIADPITRMLIRLWDQNYRRLQLDHGARFARLVDVYLCFGGKAGGEQLFDQEERNGQMVPVNTIYLYEITSFTDPMEMAREIAHEYGHATLPPIGGFTQPEFWVNGDLGERLFLKWKLEALEKGEITERDVMNVPLATLKDWVGKKVTPLSDAVWNQGPRLPILKGKDLVALDAFLGLVLFADEILPDEILGTTLFANADETATGFEKALRETLKEGPGFTIASKKWIGKTVWLPLEGRSVKGLRRLSAGKGWTSGVVEADSLVVAEKAAKE